MIETLRLELELDNRGATYITEILYNEVAKGNIKFDLKASQGSVLLKISIDVLKEVYHHEITNYSLGDIVLAGQFLRWIIKKLVDWLKKEKDSGRHYKNQIIKEGNQKIIVKENENKEIVAETDEIRENHEQNNDSQN